MLYLLDKDVRTVRWNGEPLHEATSAIVKETMNGDFTLTVKYPISDSGIYQLIQEDMLIKAPTPVLGAQLFRIKKPVEHNDHLEITAYHISDDVMQRSITPVSVTSQSCSMVLSRMVQNTKTALGDFSFNSDIQDRRTFNTTETETLYSVLLDGKHSIVGTWEGELVRDNFAMTVKKSRGENRGVVITTHKNLKDYQRTKNSQNVVTRIHAKSTFKPEGADKETTIRVTVDSPLINSYPYINEKEYENNNAKTVEELQKWAQAKFSNEGIDKVSDAIKIEAYELDGQVVNMGDTVNLKSWKHNVDAFKKAIAYEFDALKEEYISLTFDDKAGVGGSRASGGLSSAADAILGVTESAQEVALEKALQNADLDFDHKAGLLRQEIADGIELARAKAEEVKRELSDTIDQRFSSLNNGPLQEAKRRAEEALRNAGASTLLAQEAKRIGLDSIAKLEAFKSQATSAQTALSGDLDALKRTVTSEVNQASEYRRTTTEALSRMTGQMNGFATKSEVRQDVAGLTETFAKLKTDTNNLISGAKSEITLAKTEFKKTADGLSAKMSAVESYVGQDGQRQESLQRYARDESARQVSAVREQISRDYVGKSTYQEDVRGLERRFSAISTQMNNDIATKIAQYKQTVDGQFANITSQIAGKANQTDFQRVRETSQLYERIIGSSENDISNNVARMVMTNRLFQVEVAKAAKGGRNYIRNGQFKNGSKNWIEYQSVNFGLYFDYQHSKNPDNRNRPGAHFFHDSQNISNFFGLQQTFAFEGVRGEKVSVSLLVSKDGGDSYSGLKVALHYIKNKGIIGQEWQGIQSEQITSKYKRFTFTFTLSDDVENLNLMLFGEKGKTINLYVTDVQLERGSIATDYKESPDDTDEAIRSVQSQLAGSWAVQNLTSAGALVSGLNLGANGHNRLDGKLTHITGETLIDNAVIKSAMIDKLKTANFEAGSVTTVILDAEAVTAEKLKVDQAFFNKLVANEAYLNQLFAKQAFINRVQSVAIDASQVRSGILSGDRIYGGTIRGASIYGGTLTGHTQIQLGSYGSFDTVNGGLQINVPRDYNAKDGLGVQFIGSYGRGENVPYGLFLYRDSDFTIGNTATDTDEFLMTVQGYINAKGIGWLKTGKGSVNGKTTGTIGLWNSDNVSLSFGGSGNDIYYSYNSTAYSLWSVVNQHFSDRRLKENIVDCTHKALDYIHQFQFKEYDWKKQEDRPQQAHTKIGLIAQEVQEVDPALVYENGDTLNLDNLRLTNIALKAIQELALENKKLTQRLENLENERRTA
ncbi:bacteriophage PblB [Streptococcus pneumoniae]|nr:bacteriophage PblB [Streptococcus pneumoniae]VSR37937.1 bacteriophage PblB [Streptococcus pneumoniae]